jgi:hypothetical protein
MSETHRPPNMMFHILVTVFFFGLALLMGIASVMRGLYVSSTFQAPLMPGDCGSRVSFDDGHQQSHQVATLPNPPRLAERRARSQRVDIVVNLPETTYLTCVVGSQNCDNSSRSRSAVVDAT